jgi:hypothetical protein
MTALVTATVPGPGAPRSSITDPAPALVHVYALRTVSIALDVALDEAVAADERVPTFEFKVDWWGNGNYDHRWSNMTRMVESFTLTQELATDLPATIGIVEGTSASKVQINLGGQFMTDGYINADDTYLEDVDTVEAFSPYGGSGPGALLHAPVQIRTGFQTPEGPVSLLQFTGQLNGYSPAVSTREVVIDALDPVSRLRRAITVYAHGIDGVLLSQRHNAQYPFAINCQWWIDMILRTNGYFASPPTGGVIDGATTLSATMHGSYQHEIGFVSYPITGYFASIPINNPWVATYEYGVTADPNEPGAHPFQMMYPRYGYDVNMQWLARSPAPMRPGLDGWGMSGWVQLPAAGGNLTGEMWTLQPVDRPSPQLVLQMRLDHGVPFAYISYPNGAAGYYTISGFALTNQPQWMFVGIHWSSETGGIRLTMNFGGNIGSVLIPLVVPSDLVYEPTLPVYGRTLVPFTNFSVWYQYAAPGILDWRGQSWTPTAYVDPAMNWIGGAPDIINRESYDLLKEIVEAEFGTFYFDETGKPFFRSRIVNRGWNRAPELLTSERNLSDLVISVDDSQVRNSIDYEYGIWGAQGWEKVWEPDDPYFFTLNANTTNQYVIPIPENTPIIAETGPQIIKWVSSEMWDQVEDNPYYQDKIVFCASLLSDPTVDVWLGLQNGRINSALFLTFRLRRYDARNALLTIVNNSAFGVRCATASKVGTVSSTGLSDGQMTTEGKPAFRVTGRKLVEFPSIPGHVQHDRSVLMYGVQTYDLGGRSQWRQTEGSCGAMAASVLEWTAKPKPVLSAVEVQHNPRRRLNDKIILTEESSLGARIWCTLAGRTVTYDADGARDSLVLRPDDPPPGW